MKTLPQPFWAIVLAGFGMVLAMCCLFHPHGESSITLGVLAIASNLVSGALGAFAGHASANNKTDVTAVNSTANITPDA